MHSFPTIEYQRQLIAASLDDFTPNATLPNFGGGQYAENSTVWRSAVIEFLCENLRCGLIEVTHQQEMWARLNVAELKELLLSGDKTRNIDADVLWNVLYFEGTVKLSNIIDRFGLRNWDSLDAEENKDLIAVLAAMYATV